MFSYRLGNQATQVRVVLVTERGRVFGPDDPWGLLPVESFRVDSIMRTVFHEDVAPTVKDLFCKGVLARLNRSHWPRWDEIRSSLRPPGNDRLIALAVYLVEVDFLRSDPTDRAHVVKADLLHLFDPAGRLPPSTASSVWRFVV